MRTRLTCAAGLLGLGFLLATPAAATPPPGVTVEAGAGSVTSLRFRFPASVRDADARRQVEAVALALGTSARPHRASPGRYRLDARLATRASFTTSRIDASVWRRISGATDLPLRLRVQPGSHVLRGGVGRDVLYGPTAVGLWGPPVVLLLLLALAFGVLGPYARRLADGPGDVPERAHRLRALSMAGILAPLVLLMPAMLLFGWLWTPAVVVTGLFPSTAGARWVTMLSLALSFPLLFAPIVVALMRTVQPAFRRLRGVEGRERHSVRTAMVAAVPLFLYLSLRAFTHGWTRVGTAAAYLVFAFCLWPTVVVRALPTRPAPPELAERFAALCRENGVRIRGVKVLDGRRTKTANAMLLGMSRLRWVLVTDYLLDDLDDDALDAVLLHEIGHAKQHHLPKKAFAALLALVVVVVPMAAAMEAWESARGAVAALMLLAMPVTLLLVHGLLGLRLERRADDFAAAARGPEALLRGLDRLAELNDAKRRTGFVWNLLSQHPGIEQRQERLRARSRRRMAVG